MTFQLKVRRPNACPRTRQELVGHLWARGLDCNVFKEGPFYAVRAGSIIAATYTRAIDDRSFANWEQFVRSVPERML